MPDFKDLLSIFGFSALLGFSSAHAAAVVAPKVLVITMFSAETKPWLESRDLKDKLKVPGLSKDNPEISCDTKGLCVMTTDIGYANAASSVMAAVFSDRLDLRKTYILIDGIAGVDPAKASLGSALWARYVVDGGLRHDIDARQISAGWPDGQVPLGASSPTEKAKWGAGTEVYALNAALVEKAYALTRATPLLDSDAAKAYGAQYPQKAAKEPPKVAICDTVSGDTYWHGSKEAEATARFAALATDGKANYCTTQMEDNASLTALKRGADAGRVDFNRILVLRTASNFDREAPGKTPIQSLTAKSGGFGPAVTNAYRVGGAFADAVIAGWSEWEKAAP
ncbi:purine nucleoside permease [Allorhizobium sp. BGMRC 0089]|uniref:purine-nucleoside phosphorylase n=1 Tax=Allorhizobium sonneratiae TaxID=2934936 RepID=UPI002033372A|nr:purine nucleoside permease [Allorhizobium sonneratiae]MCM2293581.1 purine nucleoside permease [Allorhizobium sonneratiae]